MKINNLKELDELTENDYPNVVEVNLIELGLTEVPEKIYNLLNLEILNLGCNQIVDFNPSQPLPRLQKLILFDNQIVNFDPTQPLPSLQKLFLGSNQIFNFDPSQPLPSLHYLYLSENQIVNFDPIQPLPSLQNLYLGNNFKKNISIIYKYKNLKYITAGLNYVKLTKIINYNHFRYLNNFLDYNKNFQLIILCLLTGSNLSRELIYLILDLLLLDIYSK